MECIYLFKFRKLRNLSVIRLRSLRSLGYEVIMLPSEYRIFRLLLSGKGPRMPRFQWLSAFLDFYRTAIIFIKVCAELFQHAQLFAHLDEGGDALVEVFALVAG